MPRSLRQTISEFFTDASVSLGGSLTWEDISGRWAICRAYRRVMGGFDHPPKTLLEYITRQDPSFGAVADALLKGDLRDWPSSDLPRIDTANAPFHMPPDVER